MQHHLQYVDGVMIGREAYRHPYLLASVDQTFYKSNADIKTRKVILFEYIVYVKEQLSLGESLDLLIKPAFGLFSGLPHAKELRQRLRSFSVDVNDQLIESEWGQV